MIGDKKNPTQIEIANHLDMSERNARDVLKALNIDWTKSTLHEITVSYIRDLREKAAGRSGTHAEKLTIARIRESEINTATKEVQLVKDAGALIEADVYERELEQAIVAARQQFLSMSEGLKSEIDSRYGIDLDATIIDDAVHSTLSELVEYDAECEEANKQSLEEVGTTATNVNARACE